MYEILESNYPVTKELKKKMQVKETQKREVSSLHI